LAHMALPLIGESYAEFEGKTLPTTQILSTLNVQPITLSYKEGLGLINGTTVMAALGVFAIHEFNRLIRLATLTSCLTFEAFGARREAFDEKTHLVRGNKAQIEVAGWIRKLTADSTFIGISPERLSGKFDELAFKKSIPQDAYSIRCLPQVFGASLQALRHAEDVFASEINAAVDNPLIFADENEVLSGGNFHGQPLALVLDYLKLAVAEIGNITERQINKLVDKNTNDLLEGFLIFDENHINSGLMIPQYAAASLVSENKVLVHPASADSIPTGGNVEDHVSMGTIAGRQALEIIGNVKKIVAIQLITAHHAAAVRQKQFADRRIEATFATATKALYVKIKETIGLENDEFLYQDRFLFDDINSIIKQFDEFADFADEVL
jgi:histidine ammonia-lyase